MPGHFFQSVEGCLRVIAERHHHLRTVHNRYPVLRRSSLPQKFSRCPDGVMSRHKPHSRLKDDQDIAHLGGLACFVPLLQARAASFTWRQPGAKGHCPESSLRIFGKSDQLKQLDFLPLALVGHDKVLGLQILDRVALLVSHHHRQLNQVDFPGDPLLVRRVPSPAQLDFLRGCGQRLSEQTKNSHQATGKSYFPHRGRKVCPTASSLAW